MKNLVLAVVFATASSSAFAFEHQVVKPAAACMDVDYFKKLIHIAGENDNEALTKALVPKLMTGECITLSLKEQVFLVDTAVFQGLVQVRRHGDPREFWTIREAIK